jgi:cytochrome c oxidase subunit 2
MSSWLSRGIVFLLLPLPFGCSRSDTSQTVARTQPEAIESMSIPEPYQVEITGQKYRWHVRYPGPDGALDSPDDFTDERDVHVPVGVETVLQLRSADYVYLLSLPQFHLKEIAVPTLDFTLTLRPTAVGEYDLDGDEFCGDPHPELKGSLIVQSIPQFEDWVRQQSALSESKAGESTKVR